MSNLSSVRLFVNDLNTTDTIPYFTRYLLAQFVKDL